MQLQDFWDGLTPASCKKLSNAAGGPLMKKTPEEIITILDELSEDANQWTSENAERRRSTGVHQVSANTSVQVQLNAMAKEIRKLTLASIQNEPYAASDICGKGHPTYECQASSEEVNTVGNYNFNAMDQRHPDFSWSSPGGTANAWQQNNSRPQGQGALAFQNQQRQQFQSQRPIQSGIEDLMNFFILKTDERLETHSTTIREHGATIKELGTGFRILERQVGQIAIILSERVPGTLPADTERNPKEIVNVVNLRSGQVLKDTTPIQKEVVLENENKEQLENDIDKKKKGKKGADKKRRKLREGMNLMRASICMLYLFLKIYIEKSWTSILRDFYIC